MYYVTIRQSPMYHQMTIEELLFGEDNNDSRMISSNETNTRTYGTEKISDRIKDRVDVYELIKSLMRFNEEHKKLREIPRKELYDEFFIPKKSGGLRKIDAPKEELKEALYELKNIFENDFGALYHTSAFAYVRGRCTLDAVKRHQKNESKWFGKYDLHNFFGSTTLEYVMKMFSMIFPFSEVVKVPAGRDNLETALELAFLNGGLPQGTPISPLITNVMMIPVDYKLSNTLRDFHKQSFTYTRYADDFQISSKFAFDYTEVERLIKDTLNEFGAPFQINSEKTRYGSSSGRNWMLGVMLNKDNNITVGNKNKKHFQTMLVNYAKDRKNGVKWDINDVQVLDGYRNYYKSVEGDTIDRIIEHINKKLNVNIVSMIKKDLKS